MGIEGGTMKQKIPTLKASKNSSLQDSLSIFFSDLEGDEKLKIRLMDKENWEQCGESEFKIKGKMRGRLWEVSVKRVEEEGVHPDLQQWEFRAKTEEGVVLTGLPGCSGPVAAFVGAWEMLKSVKGYKIEIEGKKGQ